MEILKGFVWDLQRHAKPETTSVALSDLVDAEATNGQIIVLDNTGKYTAKDSPAGAEEQTIATYNAGVYTLEAEIETVVAAPSAETATIKAGSAGVTIQDKETKPTNSFSIAAAQSVAIKLYDEETGYVLSDNLTDAAGLKVIAGSVTAPLAKAEVTINDNDNVYDVTAAKAGDTVTITAGKGITDAASETKVSVKVTTEALPFMGGTMVGTTDINADGTFTLAAANTELAIAEETVAIAGGTAGCKVNGWTIVPTTGGVELTTAKDTDGGVTSITHDGTADAYVALTMTPALDGNTTLTVGKNTFVLAEGSTGATFAYGKGGNEVVDTGRLYLDTDTNANITIAKKSAPTTQVAAVQAVYGDVVAVAANGAFTSVTDLADEESVRVYGADSSDYYTLTASKDGKTVVYAPSVGDKVIFELQEGKTLANAVWTAAGIDGGTITAIDGTTPILKSTDGGDIDVAKYTTNPTYFTATGQALTEKPETYAAELSVDGSGTSATRTLTVTSDLNDGVDVIIKGVTTTVVDTSTANNTKYFITNKDNLVNVITGAEFSVSDEGVISAGTNGGTITAVADGTTGAFYLSGTVNINTDDITASEGKPADAKLLTYVAGSPVDGAKITLDNDESAIVLSESTNETDTVISTTGNITGLDAGGIVKNAVDGKTITTAGSDDSANVYTINGVEWTVTGDAETLFAVNTENATQLSEIADLDLDATVTTTKKFSQKTLTVNGTTFTDVVSKDGLTFTSTKKNEAASVELNAAGESVTVDVTIDKVTTTRQYTVVSTSDGVTIGADGKISGLTNGDVVTVHNAKDDEGQSVITLTVSEGKLVVSTVDVDGTPVEGDTTYTLDSGETSFTANPTGTYATTDKNTVVVSNGSAAEEVKGFSVGTGSDAVGKEVEINSLTNGVYLDRDGKTLADNSSGKAVAQIQLENDRITYTEIGDKAQSVIVDKNETNYEWNITTNGGKDTISYFGKENATINSGAGNDDVDAGSDNDLYINLGAGKDTVSVSGKGDHTIVAGEGNSEITVTATGDVRVDARGAGNKKIFHNVDGTTGKGGVATLYGGDGNDTIKALSTDDSVVGGAGNNVFDVTTTGMKVSDYDVTKDAVSVSVASASTNLADSQFLGDGTVSLGAGHVLDVSDGTGTDGFYAIAAKGTDGKNQFFGWAKDSGSTIDVSTVTESVILIGNNNDDKADTLMGGTKNDVIYAGEGDAVYGGAGKDLLVLDSTTGNQTVYTATTAGKDTVTGFTAGFEDGDKINFVDGTASDVTFDYTNKTVTVKDGDGSLTMTNISTVASGAVELLAANTKVALTGANGTIKTDSVSYADVYVGDGSAVDFSSVEGGLHVNLANDIAGDANLARFSGITSVKGGTGATTLMGAASAESLVSGGGNTSLWGGAGKDTLVGGDGADMFFIGAGDGTDTMAKFTGGTDATSDTLFFLSGITGAKLGTSGVEVTTTDAKAVLSGTNANTAIHYAMDGAEGVAKVGKATDKNDFTYDSTVTYYGGGSKSDKIAFTSGSTENAEIWLDGSQGKAYASIDVVDGTNTSGNLIVAGDSSSQSILGGKGDTSLWGGAGNATDTLKSSSTGKTMFWWGAGEGNDLVVSTSADDSVNLYNLQLSDVDVANSSITNSGVSLALNDGSKLTVQTGRDMNFTIDGQSWTAQHNSKTWKQNS